MKEKDKRIKELEIELLTSSQKFAAGANDHAEQMQDQADQLDKCKVQCTLCVLVFNCSTVILLLPPLPGRAFFVPL